MFDSDFELLAVELGAAPARTHPTLADLEYTTRITLGAHPQEIQDLERSWLSRWRGLAWKKAEEITGYLWGERTVTYTLNAARQKKYRFDFHRPVKTLDQAERLENDAWTNDAQTLNPLKEIELPKGVWRLQMTIGDSTDPLEDVLAFVTRIVTTMYDYREIDGYTEMNFATDSAVSILLSDYRRKGMAVLE